MRELSVAEQRYAAVLAVIADGLSVSQVVEKVGVRIRVKRDADRW
jgi:transposase